MSPVHVHTERYESILSPAKNEEDIENHVTSGIIVIESVKHRGMDVPTG
jgi:hypothetical protein